MTSNFVRPLAALVPPVVAALVLLNAPAHAQALRVLHRTPADTGTPGSLITITFNRPVAGMLGNVIDAAKVMTLTPSVPGIAEWRDPVTLRFVPDEPFVPGASYRVGIDTAAITSAGKRSAAPYEFVARFPGPTPLVIAVHGQTGRSYLNVGPLPTFRVLYSAPVDLDAVARLSRLEFSSDCGGTIPLRPVLQREIVKGEGRPFEQAGGFDRDTVGDRFRRVVELVPADSLGAGCLGEWHVASFDSTDTRDTWQYPLTVAPPFRLSNVRPCLSVYCDPDGLLVSFYPARVSEEMLRTKVHVSPSLPAPSVSARSDGITFATRLAPRTVYTVTVDTSIRDVFGRRLQGPTSQTVMAHDRVPGIKQQTGIATLPRTTDAISVRLVNVDTVGVHIVAIPDSIIPRLLSTSDYMRRGLLLDYAGKLNDSVTLRVPVTAAFNEEAVVRVPLPQWVGAPGTPVFHGIRLSVIARKVAPDSVDRLAEQVAIETTDRATGRLAAIQTTIPVVRDFGLIAQRSAFVAHSRIGGDRGVVFVTDVDGKAVSGASVTLFDGSRNAIAAGWSDANGLTMLTRANAAAVPGSPVTRDVYRERLRYLEITKGSERLVAPVTIAASVALPTRTDPESLGGSTGTASLVHATATTDRDMYRPGEMLFAKVYLRYGLLGSLAHPQTDSVRFTLVGSDTLEMATVPLTDFATAVDSVRIPANMRLGYYQLEVAVREHNEWKVWTRAFVRVAEYRAPEFLVNADIDSGLVFLGDVLKARVSANYLFDAPMAGASVRWALDGFATQPREYSIPGTHGYTLGPQRWWDWTSRDAGRSLQLIGNATLDAAGSTDLQIPVPADSFSSPVLLNFTAAVTDLSNQVVTTSQRAIAHSSSIYLGASTGGGWMWQTGREQTVDVIAVRPDGRRVAGVPIRVSILHRRQVTDSVGDLPAGAWKWVADTLEQFTVTSTADSVQVRFTPALTGAYDVLFEASDAEGRKTATNAGRWTYGYLWYTPPGVNPVRLSVERVGRDTTAYSLGDTARFTFASPFDSATAWVTIEREGILEQRTMHASKGDNTVSVPVTAKLAPGVLLGVALVPRYRIDVADSVSSVFRAGYAEFYVDSTANTLNVRVATAEASPAPGDSVTVSVAISDATHGVRSEVAVWAVDEGVLSLTGFRTPDLLRYLVPWHVGTGSTLLTTFSTLPWRAPTAYVRPGISVIEWIGDPTAGSKAPVTVTRLEGEQTIAFEDARQLSRSESGDVDAEVRLRSDFRTAAFFVGRVVTDSTGKATVRIKLPDNITTFRIMATALTEKEQFGSGEAKLVVSQPVVVRPALPRFVRYGDDLEARALVNIRGIGETEVAVTTEVSVGRLAGERTVRRTATELAGAVAGFALAIPERATADATAIRFTALGTAGSHGDAVLMTIPIKPTGAPRYHTVIGSLRDTASLVLELPADIDPDRSSISVSFGSSPVVAMRSYYERLRAYPYYCTDAIITAGRALVSLRRAEKALGDVQLTSDSAAVRADLQRGVNELLRRQSLNGDFSWFPGIPFTIGPWLTSHALDFMLEAREEGISVPQVAIDRTTRRLFNQLRTDTGWMPDTVSGSARDRAAARNQLFGTRVVMARALRKADSARLFAEADLLDWAHQLAWEDRVALAEIVGEFDVDSARGMLNEAWRAVSVVGRRLEFADSLRGAAPFPSHVRPASRLLSATLALAPDHPLLGALSETIVQQGAAETRWAWNTQDYGAAIEALALLARGQRDYTNATVQLRARGRRVLSRSVERATSVDTTAALTGLLDQRTGETRRLKLNAELGGAKEMATPLYFSVTVKEVPLERPVTPDVKGIIVERWYERFDDGTPVTAVGEGELVRVRLRISVPADRQFVAVEDMLPAGLEPVDLSLRTSSSLGPFSAPVTDVHPSVARVREPGPLWQSVLYGSLDGGYWSPWEYKEMRDDRVIYYARQLWAGTYNAGYVARATTVGTFVRPPAHAQEMYNPAVQGRSDGGVFVVRRGGGR